MLGGIAIGAASSQRTRKLIVGVTVAMHLLLLSTFKYLDFLVGSANHLLHAFGAGSRAAVHGDHPAGRHLVLHVPRHLVPGRRLSRRCRGVPAAWSTSCCICRSSRSLSPARSCARRIFLPQLARPPAERVPLAEPVLLILGGLFKKVVIADLSRDRPGRSGVLRSVALRQRRPGARGLRLRGADLLRLLRLHRHGDRAGGAARLSVSEQLRSAVPRAAACASSGSAGTSRCRRGCATISTYHSAAVAAAAGSPRAT